MSAFLLHYPRSPPSRQLFLLAQHAWDPEARGSNGAAGYTSNADHVIFSLSCGFRFKIGVHKAFRFTLFPRVPKPPMMPRNIIVQTFDRKATSDARF
jgi:hypothetical protein